MNLSLKKPCPFLKTPIALAPTLGKVKVKALAAPGFSHRCSKSGFEPPSLHSLVLWSVTGFWAGVLELKLGEAGKDTAAHTSWTLGAPLTPNSAYFAKGFT